jgi:hypothetical protein
MPHDGEKCTTLGTYKTDCCEVELVIAAGAKFPRCTKHPEEPTEWRLLPELIQRPDKASHKAKK